MNFYYDKKDKLAACNNRGQNKNTIINKTVTACGMKTNLPNILCTLLYAPTYIYIYRGGVIKKIVVRAMKWPSKGGGILPPARSFGSKLSLVARCSHL